MNKEEKQIAIKSKKLADTFRMVMKHLKLTQNEECSVIMTLLCSYLAKRNEDPESFLKWISKTVPVVIKNWNKTGYGHVSGTGDNAKIEMIDK